MDSCLQHKGIREKRRHEPTRVRAVTSESVVPREPCEVTWIKGEPMGNYAQSAEDRWNKSENEK